MYQVQLVGRDTRTALCETVTYTEACAKQLMWSKVYPGQTVKVISRNSKQWLEIPHGQ